jgi:hypothetical protein
VLLKVSISLYHSLLRGGKGLPDKSIIATACVFTCAWGSKMMKIMSLKIEITSQQTLQT